MKSISDCIDRALAGLDPRLRTTFADDPLRAISIEVGLKVRAVDHLAERRNDGGTCDGMSFLQDGVILYAATANRRENFTLSHEFGHWLVDQADEIFDWLADQPQPAVALETLCDRIASRLLVPDDVLDRIVGGGPVEARFVAELYDATNASLPVCVIALAGRLSVLGAVIVVDRAARTVTYASIHPDPARGWPIVHPWPKQTLPAGHPLGSLTSGATTRCRSYWATPWGTRAEFYFDAYAGDARIVAVLAETDLWGVERFHPNGAREFDRRPQLELRCCGRTRTLRAYPCPECGHPNCPECGNCRCDRLTAKEVRCAGRCGLQYLPHLLEGGLCEECR